MRTPPRHDARALLCRAAGLRRPVPRAGRAPPPLACDPASCPGPAHLRSLGEALGRWAGLPPSLLLERFGQVLFERLARAYPAFFVGIESTADLVSRYQVHVAAELAKLDESLKPPHLSVARAGADWVVLYRSAHDLDDLAAGLLRGSLEYFGEPLELWREPRSRMRGGGTRFLLRIPARPAEDTKAAPSLCAVPQRD